MVLETMRRAQAGITERVAEVMTENLGEEDQETRGVLLDSLRGRFPDPDEPEDGPPEPDNSPDPEPVPPSPTAGGAAIPPAAPTSPPARRPGGIDPDEQDNNPW